MPAAGLELLINSSNSKGIRQMGRMGGSSSNEIMQWVQKNGKIVSQNEWSKSSDSKQQNNMEMDGQKLYYLKGTVK